MLRSEFEGHALWATLAQVHEMAQSVREDHSPADLPALDTTEFYASHVESFRDLGASYSAFFSDAMMEPVKQTFDSVVANLNTRKSNGPAYSQYTESAATQAESSLIELAPWPRPFARGAQVGQLTTLFEDLLERQRLSVDALSAEHEALRAQIATYSAEIETMKKEALDKLAEVSASGITVAETVDAQKVRVDEVVADGLKAVASVADTNTTNYEKWIKDRTSAFANDFDPLKEKIELDLDEASTMLDKLQLKEVEYSNLVSAVGTGELSKHFAREAVLGRVGGVLLYLFGVTLLAAAAIPLALLLGDDAKGLDLSWQQVVARLSIGVLGASAATVVIRLGARFISDANASKRMELEMRTFAPFLANVTDRETVDAARLQIIDRSFGKSYAPLEATSKDDAIPVSTYSQILAAVAKLIGR